MGITRKSIGAFAVAGATTFAVSAAAVPAQAAESSGATVRATCFGGAFGYTKGTNQLLVPSGAPTTRYTTGANCADINIKTRVLEAVRVCFVRTGCQGSYRLTQAGVWTAVATNVLDNVPYYFDFGRSPASSGQVAD